MRDVRMNWNNLCMRAKNKHITQRVSAYQIDQVSYKSAQTVNNQSV